MSKANELITKETFNKLNDSSRSLYLFDEQDNSKIIIDDELLQLIRKYYQSKLEVDYG